MSTVICGAPVETGPVGAGPSRPLVERRLGDGAVRLVADRRQAVLEYRGEARFSVENGELIRVEYATGADRAAVEATLYGTVVALLLAQRDRFALHASTVRIGPAGVALTGRSGAGKSTAALALRQRGARLITDDVSPIRPDGPVEVEPYGRPLHVWPDTAAAFGIDLAGSGPVVAGLLKRAVRVGDAPVTALDAVVLLDVDPGAAEVHAARLGPQRGVAAVHANAYRGRLLAALYGPTLFAWAADIARRVPVWTVIRPAAGWSAEKVTAEVAACVRVRTARTT